MLDDILFVHPKDVQDGKVDIGPRDITTNLPYAEGAHLAFDHHASEAVRVGNDRPNHVIVPHADSARYSQEDILDPQGWVLLSYLMDPRTGLGRFRDFRISNYQLMMDLIDECTSLPIEEILETPDVKERVDLYRAHERKAIDQIRRCATVYGNLVVLDLRDEEIIHPTNRFMIYALHPDQNVSMHVLWGLKQQNTVFAVGKSILDRRCRVDIGALMLEYGGGGHSAAGTCQIENEDAERVLDELIGRITGGMAAAA